MQVGKVENICFVMFVVWDNTVPIINLIENLKYFFLSFFFLLCIAFLSWQGLAWETRSYLPPPSSGLEIGSTDGRSSTICPFCSNALCALPPCVRWHPVAFMCTWTDWSRAACYHGDHFLENTGREEGCQWCKLQEHRETAGERSLTLWISEKQTNRVLYCCS